MSNEQEMIADIVAELRSCQTNTVLGGMVSLICNRLADRIEAAAKREELRWANANGELARMIDLEKAQGGNAAAMREALEKCRDLAETLWLSGTGEDMSSEIAELKDTINAALSAPPRNCELYKCEEDAWLAFSTAHGGINASTDEYEKWLFERSEHTEKGK